MQLGPQLRRLPPGVLGYLLVAALYAEWGIGHLAEPLARLARLRLFNYGAIALLLILVQSLLLDWLLQTVASSRR